MKAYEEALTETSRPWAPWYAIPADDKPFMRLTVAEIVAETLADLDPRYPEVDQAEKKKMDELGRALQRGEL